MRGDLKRYFMSSSELVSGSDTSIRVGTHANNGAVPDQTSDLRLWEGYDYMNPSHAGVS